jgi:hypothetical protein
VKDKIIEYYVIKELINNYNKDNKLDYNDSNVDLLKELNYVIDFSNSLITRLINKDNSVKYVELVRLLSYIDLDLYNTHGIMLND